MVAECWSQYLASRKSGVQSFVSPPKESVLIADAGKGLLPEILENYYK